MKSVDKSAIVDKVNATFFPKYDNKQKESDFLTD